MNSNNCTENEDLESMFIRFHRMEDVRSTSSSSSVSELQRKVTWKIRGSDNCYCAMWFELLADVAVLVSMYKMTLENSFTSIEDLFRIIAKFIFIWQVWFGQVLILCQFDTDFFLFRLLQLIQVISISTIGITRPFAATNEDAYRVFVGTIVISKIILLIQLVLSPHRLKDVHRLWILSTIVEIVLWSCTFNFKTTYNNDYNSTIWFWRIGVMLECFTSIYSGATSHKMNSNFLQDRFALMTIALFGKLWFGIAIFLKDFSYIYLAIIILHTLLIFAFWHIYYFSTRAYELVDKPIFKASWMFLELIFHLLLFVASSATYDISMYNSTREMSIELTSFCILLLILSITSTLDRNHSKRILFMVGRVVFAFIGLITVFATDISSYYQYIICLTVLTGLLLLLMVIEWSMYMRYFDKPLISINKPTRI